MAKINSLRKLRHRKAELKAEMKRSEREIKNISDEFRSRDFLKNSLKSGDASLYAKILSLLPALSFLAPRVARYLPVKSNWKMYITMLPVIIGFGSFFFFRIKGELKKR